MPSSSPTKDVPADRPASESLESAQLVGCLVAGRYRILQLLGEGGMGAVYLAEHTHMRKRVALKLLHKEMSDNAEVLARFEREAMAASHIEHPNVAGATDFGRTGDGAFFLVLEYVEGTCLRDVVAKGPMPAGRAVHIARQIALALERAHDAGIVHRDLKPENVMLVRREDDADFVKVLDFGIAKVSDQTIAARGGATDQPLTRLGTVLGTPEYMAPEQALGETVTPAADLYAVGIMLYEMLTGLLPFDPPDRMAMLSFHIVAPVPAMQDRAPSLEVPAPIEAVVRRLLEKDSKQRPASARALVQGLEEAAAASGIALTGSTPAPPESAPPAASPSSAVVAPISSTPITGARDAWREPDSFAETSLGMPAASVPRPTTARFSTSAALDLLRAQPRNLQIALAAAVPIAIIALVLVIVLAGRRATSAGDVDGGEATAGGSAAPAKPKLAPPAEVQAATTEGPEALDELSRKYPDDPSLPKQVVAAYASAGRSGDAMRKVATILSNDARASMDDELVKVVVKTAEKGKGSDDDAAFALLEGALGARGVDELIEMSERAQPRSPLARRVGESLAKPEVRAHASKAAAVLLDFKAARACTSKKDLLDRMKDEGDARALAALRKLVADRRGCGFLGRGDCWSCLRRGPLEDAVAGLESRLAEK